MNKNTWFSSKRPLIFPFMNPLMFFRPFLRGAAAGLAFAVMGLWTAPVMAQRTAGAVALRPVYNQWTTWLNPRFAFELPVPPGLRAQTDPRKGSSCRFGSDDATVILKAWGATLVPAPGDPLEPAWREAVNLRGRRIDFQRRDPQAFVLAGVTSDGSEFFEKVILGNGATAGFNVAYPPSLARRMARVVDEIEQGFGWHPQAAALSPQGVPSRGFFSGVRDYFTGEDTPEPPSSRGWDSDAPSIPRDPSQTRVDLTPPPPPSAAGSSKLRDNAPDRSLEKVYPQDRPTPAPVKPAPPVKREDLPYGIVIPGKQGYVYSPFSTKQQVDVSGIPTGTKVKCPYTSKVFRVP